MEVQTFLQKAAIKAVTPCTGHFFSRLFMKSKKEGACRPVVNLRPLNRYIRKMHFNMEDSSLIRDILRTGDWMTTINLEDTFLSVPIHEDHRKFQHF